MEIANPNYETLKLTLWIASGVIGMLLLVVAYFLSKQVSVSETLTKAVNSLTSAVMVLESQQRDRHPVIERRLNSHAARLDEHDKEIVRIKTVCGIT